METFPDSVTHNPNLDKGFKQHHESTNTLIHLSDSGTSLSPDSEEETFDVQHFNDATLKYISDILLDEDLEGKNCMLQDSLALQAAEKSFYDVLNPKETPLSNQVSQLYQTFEYLKDDFIHMLRHSSLVQSFSNTLKLQSHGNFDTNDKVRNEGNESRGKKNHQREDEQLTEEERSRKQSAVSAADDTEPQDLFDKVLLCQGDHHEEWESCTPYCSMKKEETKKLQPNRQPKGSKTERSKLKTNNEESVDFTTMHGIINGRHNTPFFATRFKEALLHYYTLFDIFEATIPREERRRLMLERDNHGRDIMNIVACEGVERVERPETYKKWQMRNVKAGLKQLPVDQELLKKAKKLSKQMGYHNEFRIEEDGDWVLHEWKGRIFTGLSFWKPA